METVEIIVNIERPTIGRAGGGLLPKVPALTPEVAVTTCLGWRVNPRDAAAFGERPV